MCDQLPIPLWTLRIDASSQVASIWIDHLRLLVCLSCDWIMHCNWFCCRFAFLIKSTSAIAMLLTWHSKSSLHISGYSMDCTKTWVRNNNTHVAHCWQCFTSMRVADEVANFWSLAVSVKQWFGSSAMLWKRNYLPWNSAYLITLLLLLLICTVDFRARNIQLLIWLWSADAATKWPVLAIFYWYTFWDDPCFAIWTVSSCQFSLCISGMRSSWFMVSC